MTGEITLRGNILPIGGLSEKLLAAKRSGIYKVLIPAENKSDTDDLRAEITKDLEIITVKHIDDALPHVFRNWNDFPKNSKKSCNGAK